jgi:hypothetical protein
MMKIPIIYIIILNYLIIDNFIMIYFICIYYTYYIYFLDISKHILLHQNLCSQTYLHFNIKYFFIFYLVLTIYNIIYNIY